MKTSLLVREEVLSKHQIDLPVAVLYNKSDQLIKGEQSDLIADEGVVLCAESIVEALRSMDIQVADVPFDNDVESALRAFSADEWVVFNLGEGMAGKFYEESRIAWALEAMGYTFTGCGGDAISRSVNKAYAKSLLQKNGLPTPDWWLFANPDEVGSAAFSGITFPLIVKPVAEDGSIGLDNSAVVHDMEALQDRVAYIKEVYTQTALAERFIVGRELNVGLLGNPPRVLPLAEIDFSDFDDPYEKIVSFDAKWAEDSFEYNHTPAICPADLPPKVVAAVRRVALQAWDVMGCSGYARVDMRLDSRNVPYIVEVNCNPDISPNAGFHNAARTAGYSYESMIVEILKHARRHSDGYRQTRTGNRWRSN